MIAIADEETHGTHIDTDVTWKVELHRRIDDIKSERVQPVSGPETLRLARQPIASRDWNRCPS